MHGNPDKYKYQKIFSAQPTHTRPAWHYKSHKVWKIKQTLDMPIRFNSKNTSDLVTAANLILPPSCFIFSNIKIHPCKLETTQSSLHTDTTTLNYHNTLIS